MQHRIRGEASWAIDLDESERFEMSGKQEYGRTIYTILVERVHNARIGYGENATQGLSFSGTRILKSGKTSYETKRFELADDDHRVPDEILDRAHLLRGRVEALRRHIERVSAMPL